MTVKQFETMTKASMNRRSLLKRAGALGLSLPAAGVLLSACGGDDGGADAANQASTDSSSAGSQPAAGTQELTITAVDMAFEPDAVTVEAGQKVKLTFINEGSIEHDWAVTDLTVDGFTVVSQPDNSSSRVTGLLRDKTGENTPYAGAGSGQQMVIEFTPTQGGEYEMLCLVPGHAAAGMVGTFTVNGGAAASTGESEEQTDGQTTAAAQPGGTPYEADRLPSPAVAAPVGSRGPETIQFEMEIKEVVGKVDEGVAYEFWTFDGTIPGTMLRARVGDTIEMTLKNPAESQVTHNIDLHAVTGPGGGAEVTNVAPGQSATFRFKALNPGAFVYHCAVAPVAHHISNGMYGMIVIEPEGGLPPVDKEFYVMQGDLYMEGARGDKGLRNFSMDKLLDERPDYVVFNGSVGSLMEERTLTANVGETVRIFFGVGGPNITSSFHVIGEIFDRVYQESASEPVTNVQTTMVPAGGATMVEFTCEYPGTYKMVDHSLGRLNKGAIGLIQIEGEADAEIFEVVSEAQ